MGLVRMGESVFWSLRRLGWGSAKSVQKVARAHGREDVLEAIADELSIEKSITRVEVA
jgi:hypothetical protein